MALAWKRRRLNRVPTVRATDEWSRTRTEPLTRTPRNAQLFLFYSVGLGVSWAMANLALNLLLDAQGVDNASIGLYNALIVAGTITIALPLGLHGGRLGRRRVLIAATTTTPLALLVVIAAPPGPYQMLGAFLLGASESIYFTVGYPHMAENSPADGRLWLYSRSAFSYYAGMFVGYLLSTGVSSTVRLVAPDADTVTAMRVVLGVAALMAASCLVPLVRTGPPAYAESGAPGRSAAMSSIRSRFLAVYAIAGLGTGAMVPFVQLFLTQRYSLSVAVVGWLLAIGQLVTAAGTLASDRLARSLTATRALLVVQTLLVPFTAAIAYGGVLLVVVVALMARGLLADVQEPILNGQVMTRVAPQQRSAAATANQTVWLIGMMLGSAASGWLQEVSGWEAGFSLTVLSSVALTLVFAANLRSDGSPDVEGSVPRR